MLQIYIYTDSGGGFLDLPVDAVMQTEETTPLFDEDLSAGDLSLPGTADWTEQNKILLNYANVLNNGNPANRSFICDVYDSGIPEYQGVKFQIIEQDNYWNYKHGSFSYNITGQRGLFGDHILNKKMTSLLLGGVITFAVSPTFYNSRDFATAVMQGLLPQYHYISFAPLAFEGFFDANHKDYNNEFLAQGTVNTVVIQSNNTWLFGRPSINDPQVPATSNETEFKDHRTIPFFKLVFVLSQIFEEHGFSVSGSIFTDIAFMRLYLFNNYALETYISWFILNYQNHSDFNTTITPGNHMPNMLIADWLKSFCATFNCYFKPSGIKSFEIIFREKRLKDKSYADITPFIIQTYKNRYSEEAGKGFELEYSPDGDSYWSSRFINEEDYNLIGTVNKTNQLGTLDNTPGINTTCIAYVESENLYYQVIDASVNPKKWNVIGERMRKYVTNTNDDGQTAITLAAAPLAQYLEEDPNTQLLIRRPYLGVGMQGSYFGKSNWVKNQNFGLRFFYIAMETAESAPVQVPVSYNWYKHPSGIVREPMMLTLDGETALWFGDRFIAGMYSNYFKQWLALKDKAHILTAFVRLDQQLKQLLNNNERVLIENIFFYLSKKLIDLPVAENPQAEIELVPE